jgi:predicted phosphoadenosine phosphosulfate sulfurtransferase
MSKVHKKKEIEQNVYELALERIRRTYDIFDNVVVMFSGGKDSTVCLNLTLEVAKERNKLPLEVYFFDEEAIPYETIDYVKRVADLPEVKMNWLCVPVKHRNGCSRSEPYWYPWGPEDKDKWVRPMPDYDCVITGDDLDFFPSEISQRPTVPECNGLLFPPQTWGEVGVIMGIRSEESLTRYRTILQTGDGKRYEDYIISLKSKTALGNVFKVCPIYDMKTVDVWTLPQKFKWDYNTTYDILEKLGLTHLQQRCAPPYGEEPMRGLWQYSVAFPDIWEKMQTRVAGAATAARYANTELYGFGGLPEKPKDMTWLEFVKYYIGKHPQPYRSEVAKRIQEQIDAHYQKTSEPILSTHHYVTGVGWEYLLRIAMRGDYKGRKQPLFTTDPKQQESQKKKYEAERYGKR